MNLMHGANRTGGDRVRIDEENRRNRQFAQNRPGVIELLAQPVVERDHHGRRCQGVLAFDRRPQFGSRDKSADSLQELELRGKLRGRNAMNARIGKIKRRPNVMKIDGN